MYVWAALLIMDTQAGDNTTDKLSTGSPQATTSNLALHAPVMDLPLRGVLSSKRPW